MRQTEAAFSCGFSDEKYFMKVFKKFEGMTPAQYKNSFGRKNIN
ncbi:MAG: AraC family transcriptional regulator [Oscillospiraceae bacterium]|nr:AraC family transcriptional regulator [Oscillospiraceae bacterium]